MYNFQTIRQMSDKELFFLIKKAEIMRGKKGRMLRAHIEWLFEEVF